MKRGLWSVLVGAVLLGLGLSAGVASAARPALPPNFARVPVGAGLTYPTAMVFVGQRIFVTEKGGAIRIVKANGTLRTNPFATFAVSTESERGLLGIEVDPDYPANGFLYIYYTTGPGAKNFSGTPENRVSRIKKKKNAPGVRERILLDHIPSTSGNHNGGDIHIGFDGKLYIAVGESGCCPTDAQGLDTLRGKILRINLDGSIPTDNPFYNTAGARQETYAYGFRNPWRFALRPSNQSYIVADVGQRTWEEIDSLAEGANYGWPVYEGPCPSNNLSCDPNTVDYDGTVKPVHWYHHKNATEGGEVIVGGVFAENSNYPAPYANAYFYGDGVGAWVHVVTMNGSNAVTGQYEFDSGLAYPVSFGHGPDGNVYVVDYGAGVLFKYVYTP